MKFKKLNLGCGIKTPEGWINVDYALGARLMKIPFFHIVNRHLKLFRSEWSPDIFVCNLRKVFPWKDNSIDVIYSSHVLEHFSRKEGIFFLRECYRVLKKDGLIRVVVPDLKALIIRYDRNEFGADEFIQKLGVFDHFEKLSYLRRAIARLFGFPHRCMYDTKTLLAIMQNIGFAAERKEPFESEMHAIESIEQDNRVRDAVIVEGRKVTAKRL